MISFKILTSESRRSLEEWIYVEIPLVQREYVSEIFDSLAEEDCETAVSVFADCLLIRIFDGEYLFSYPVAMTDLADEGLAVEQLRAYAVKEEVPLTLCDVPAECVRWVREYFPHTDSFAESDSGESYTVRVLSELMLTDTPPCGRGERLEITELRTEDESEYARLCRDEETNRYWGYDFRDDNPGLDDGFFLRSAEEEYSLGVAVSLAIRERGHFVGETVLYAFDLRGGAEFAVRILPEYRGRGYATEALAVLKNIALCLGLNTLYTTIDRNNTASVRAFEKRFSLIEDNDKILRFSLKL